MKEIQPLYTCVFRNQEPLLMNGASGNNDGLKNSLKEVCGRDLLRSRDC